MCFQQHFEQHLHTSRKYCKYEAKDEDAPDEETDVPEFELQEIASLFNLDDIIKNIL